MLTESSAHFFAPVKVQAKHVDGLQPDGWILLKMLSFSSYGWLTVMTFSYLASQTPIGSIRTVGQLWGAERSSEKAYIKQALPSCNVLT